MVDRATPKPPEDLPTAFLVVLIAGAMVLGWLNSQDWLGRKSDSSGDGSSGDDGAAHHAKVSGHRAGSDGSEDR